MKPRSMGPIATGATALFCIATLASGAGPRSAPAEPATHAASDTKPLWRFPAKSDIRFFQLASPDPPRLVVATQDALLLVDATTGKALWSREDLRKVLAVNLDLMDAAPADPIPVGRGIALIGDVLHIFDLETGAKLSDSGSWSVKSVCCYLPVYGHGLVLVIARTAASERALLGVDVRSGAVRWRRELFFREKLELNEAPASELSGTLFGNQPPLQVDEANLLLYVSEDGVFDLDPATGKIVWGGMIKGPVLKGKAVPRTSSSYAPILVEAGVAYVPSKHTLVALKISDGTPSWPSAAELPGQVVQMKWTTRGLLVAGAKLGGPQNNLLFSPFLDLLDPATGRSRWRARVDLKGWSRFTVQGDTAYLAAKGALVAVDLATGSARDVATSAFEGGEQPSRVEARPEGFLLMSDHNLLWLGADGAKKYQVYYPAPLVGHLSFIERALLRNPGEGFLHELGRALVTRPLTRGVTGLARDFVYMFTTAPDIRGQQGVSLVRVNKADGAEAGRIWVSEESLSFETDPAADVVYMKQGDRAIVALRFDAGTSGPP